MEPQTMDQFPFGIGNTMDEDSTYYSSPISPTNTPKRIQKHSPMLIYMPECTYPVNIRFRIRAHAGSDPSNHLQYLNRCLDYRIQISKSTHPTKQSILTEIENAVKKLSITEPYSNPNSWQFVVAKEVIDRIPKLTKVGVSEEYWPFVPLSVLSNGEYIISLVSQYGPPKYEVMKEWICNSGKRYIWDQCCHAYQEFYEEEWRLDMNTEDRFYPLGSVEESSATPEDSSMEEEDMEMDEPELEEAPLDVVESSNANASRKRRFSDVAPAGSEIGLQGNIANRKKARCHMPSASLGSSDTLSFGSWGKS